MIELIPGVGIAEHREVKSKGKHFLSICDVRSKEAQDLSAQIETVAFRRGTLLKFIDLGQNREKAPKILEALHEEYTCLIKELHRKFLVRQLYKENITCTVGRSVLAQRLAAVTTYTGTINYTALGTGTNTPVVGDTQLQTETYRKALSSGTYASNVSYIETFFTASEVSGTFQEYGNFIDGSGSANSGQLFNHFLQTVVKAVTETLNVQSIFTFSDA